MKHEKEVWQSEGRKEIAVDKAAMLKEYERVRLEEEKVKSEQIRAAREVRRVEEKAMKHEKEVWQSDGRKEIAIEKAKDLKRLEEETLEADKVKSANVAAAKVARLAEEKAIKHQRNLHEIEGRQEARRHQEELQRLAEEAAHDATFAGLMNPYNWSLGGESTAGVFSSAADDGGAAATPGAFDRFTLFT